MRGRVGRGKEQRREEGRGVRKEGGKKGES